MDAPLNGETPMISPLSGTPLLTNNGTITTTSESANDNLVLVSLMNSSTGTVEVKSGVLDQNAATTTTNAGTVKTDAPVRRRAPAHERGRGVRERWVVVERRVGDAVG